MKTKIWIQLLLLVGLILGIVFSYMNKKSKLNECCKEIQAVIISKDHRHSRGDFIKYRYIVSDVSYTSSEPLAKEEENIFFVGDTINIIISCSDNDVSKFRNKELFKCEKKN